MLNQGRLLLIVNPTAQSGRGQNASEEAISHLRSLLGPDCLDVTYTQHACHAVELARDADAQYSTVIALGGDGIIHEVVNGLMARPEGERPTMGIIPVGSGNDYARSLGVSTNVEKACLAIARGNSRLVDIGKVNEHYFMETLSFGLDAAIALDTVERRKTSGKSGFSLYLESGLDIFMHHLVSYKYQACFKGIQGKTKHRRLSNVEETLGEGCTRERGESFIFAVQNGPTYGGGFKVCPDASLDDGLFDICIAHSPVSIPFALTMFLSAAAGKHTGFKQLEFLQMEGMEISFNADVPAQMDGEKICADTYVVSMCPKALNVIFGN